MTKRVDAHQASASMGVVQEMGLNKDDRAPVSIVELAVSCRHLLDMDTFSKSDPMCVLYIQQFASKQWREFGRSEIVWNNLNPNFVKKFVMEYYFEERQQLMFEIYDVDCKSPDLSKHDFLGRSECTLGEIVSASRLQQPLRGPKKNSGSIILSAEELSSCKDEVTLQFCGKKLDKKDLFGKSDPFLLFYRANEDTSFTVLHKTEVIKNTLNPTWAPFTVPVRALCNGDYDRMLKVECYDWDRDGGHDLIGIFSVTLRELSRGPGKHNNYECINAKKQAKKGKKYQNSGTVELMQCKIEKVFTFLDYVKGGTEVNCTVAVDFTASNGDPRQPTSLHYMDPNKPNLYSRALRAVMEIIQDYDSDKLFPALGFGARLPPDGRVSHEFFLNGHPSNPSCQGVEGVMKAYHDTLSRVQLHGPTNFAPVINHVVRIADHNANGDLYHILVILTDGIITDMPQTCEAIVNAATLPISIIIIGIGDADFEAMNILDGDNVRLSSRGRFAERDIVQFVPFNEFTEGRHGNDLTKSQSLLAKEVLAEIPEQFLSFMKKKNILPKPPFTKRLTLPTAPSASATSASAPRV